MILSPVKYQLNGRKLKKNPRRISWQTHLKHSKPYIFMYKERRSPQMDFLLISSLPQQSSYYLVIFLHRLYRLLKAELNWIRVPTTEFSRKKYRTRKADPNSSHLSCKTRKNPTKGHTKNRTFVFCKI